MIINIAGPNGSGKTTVVRKLLDQSRGYSSVHKDGREAPIGYVLNLPGVSKPIYILGAYTVGTGGADTLKRDGIVDIFATVENRAASYHVVYEGAFVMNHTRGPDLCKRLGIPYHIILLTTPLEVCFQEIAKRREATEFSSPALQRRNIQINNVRAHNYAAKMNMAGAKVYRVGRDAAFERLVSILKGAAT